MAGTIIGGALGVAAGLLLAPESGKKLRADIQKKSTQFYTYIAPQLKKIKKMTEGEYKAFVSKAAQTYSKSKKLSLKEEKALVAEASKTWKHLKKHLS